MRIATFNVENLDLPLGHRGEVLRPALERLDADILCLQEVNGQRAAGQRGRQLEALDQLLDGTPYAGHHRAFSELRPGAGVADVHNLVTLSRLPILERRLVRHDIVTPLGYRFATAAPEEAGPAPIVFERPLLVTVHDTGGAPLTIVNVHLRAPLASLVAGQKSGPFAWRSVRGWAEGYFVSAMKRGGQALELRLVIDEIFDREPAALLAIAGDFNAEDHETAVRIAAGAPEDTGSADLAGRSLVVLDRGIDPARRFSLLHHGRPQMVDHLLASQALYGRFRSIEVHNEPLGDELVGYARNVPAAGSWHAPVVATFDIAAAAPVTAAPGPASAAS